MAYEFKKLSDVAAVETPAATANVLIEEDGIIKKVAKDNVVPAVEALPLPETATIGQTFKVSEVDENGKVTKVEAVDMPKIIPIIFDADSPNSFEIPQGTYQTILDCIRNGTLFQVIVRNISDSRKGIRYIQNVCTDLTYDNPQIQLENDLTIFSDDSYYYD